MDVYDNARLQMNSDRKKRSIRGDHHSMAEEKVRQLFEKDIAQKRGDVEGDQFDGVETRKRMKKNATFSPRYEAVEAHCKCLGTLEMGCILFRTPPQNNYSICVCTYDHSSMEAHPCFNATRSTSIKMNLRIRGKYAQTTKNLYEHEALSI
ncbi:hypothetical protein TELCIR_13734 [Teladorsagia circumcincta]|uniref:Uncharacterized protein n=1 Tax=Teladorsagia circumcincta TaxID=45464 RepID=A0A2G9U322_TELCI|nr:hypothetical protein TELCIR_13734 [Teladorsagia circumcincta]